MLQLTGLCERRYFTSGFCKTGDIDLFQYLIIIDKTPGRKYEHVKHSYEELLKASIRVCKNETIRPGKNTRT
jgi:hypothetical protein